MRTKKLKMKVLSHVVFNCILFLSSHTLIRVFPRSHEQVKRLIGFTDPDHQIDILKATRGFNDSTDFLVPPQKMEFINKFITSNELHSQVKTLNYGRYVVLFFCILSKLALFIFKIFSPIKSFMWTVYIWCTLIFCWYIRKKTIFVCLDLNNRYTLSLF